MLAAIGIERSPSAPATSCWRLVRKRTVETRAELTAQEQQIVGLARGAYQPGDQRPDCSSARTVE